jgi:hypothetical protein
MFSRKLDQPLAQGFFSAKALLADVSIWRKTANRQHYNFTGNGTFSQADTGALWISKG